MDELSPVRFEHHREALGIGEPAPRLSWRVAAEPGWRQAAYELAIGDEVFRVASAESVLVPWPAAPLRPREARTVRVRVNGAGGCVSDWSDPATVERGLDAGGWQARLIEPGPPRARYRGPAAPRVLRGRRLRRGPAVRHRPRDLRRRDQRQARRRRRTRAGLDELPRRLRSQAYDVTALLRPGVNAIGFQVADGWWRGGLEFGPVPGTLWNLARAARAA